MMVRPGDAMSLTGSGSTSVTTRHVLGQHGSGAFPSGGAQASTGARLGKEMQRRRG
jgi:hypothetical protein